MQKSLVTLSLMVLLTGCASQTLPVSEPATVATIDPVATQTEITTSADDPTPTDPSDNGTDADYTLALSSIAYNEYYWEMDNEALPFSTTFITSADDMRAYTETGMLPSDLHDSIIHDDEFFSKNTILVAFVPVNDGSTTCELGDISYDEALTMYVDTASGRDIVEYPATWAVYAIVATKDLPKDFKTTGCNLVVNGSLEVVGGT